MKLYRFRYSPYARKVQLLLDLMGAKYQTIEVPYSDRNEIARLTGGYIYVPVLVEDDGTVVTESRTICERLCATERGARFVPSPFEGPIWAYCDFVDGAFEDVTFRIASPAVRDKWESPGDRALYNLIKERKFGAGCIDAWLRDRPELFRRARHLVGPTLKTLKAQPFLFGKDPTLADCALYGTLAMLEEGDKSLVPQLAPELVPYMRKLEALAG